MIEALQLLLLERVVADPRFARVLRCIPAYELEVLRLLEHDLHEVALPAGDGGVAHDEAVHVPLGSRRELALLLALLTGFEPGQTACILGFNRPEWAILDLAAMGVGGAPAGIYTTCSPVEVRYIVAHAEAPIILVENVFRVLNKRKGEASILEGFKPGTAPPDGYSSVGISDPDGRPVGGVQDSAPPPRVTLLHSAWTSLASTSIQEVA